MNWQIRLIQSILNLNNFLAKFDFINEATSTRWVFGTLYIWEISLVSIVANRNTSDCRNRLLSPTYKKSWKIWQSRTRMSHLQMLYLGGFSILFFSSQDLDCVRILLFRVGHDAGDIVLTPTGASGALLGTELEHFRWRCQVRRIHHEYRFYRGS